MDSERYRIMDSERYRKLDEEGKGLKVGEIFEGWHFCLDHDGRLVGPGMPEWESCTCCSVRIIGEKLLERGPRR